MAIKVKQNGHMGNSCIPAIHRGHTAFSKIIKAVSPKIAYVSVNLRNKQLPGSAVGQISLPVFLRRQEAAE